MRRLLVVAFLVSTACAPATDLSQQAMTSCQRDTVRTGLMGAARAWADGDAGALAALLSPSGKVTYVDVGRGSGAAEYRGGQLADYMAARVQPKEVLVLNRVEPPYRTIPDGELLHAFVVRDGLDYPVVFRGFTDCQRGLAFRDVFVEVGGR